ncbi:MAG: hypothetical protein ACQET3_11105 [Promethearchaeati archaeon]
MVSSRDARPWLEVVRGSTTDAVGGYGDRLQVSFSHSYSYVGGAAPVDYVLIRLEGG